MERHDETRFEFGANWSNFIDRSFSQERVDISRLHLLQFVGKDSLEGMRFLDIGCGSGLHSLAALQAGAKSIISFDYDAQSVAAARQLHRLTGAPAHWQIAQGSVLDADFMARLARADLVYAWGVLHHTGDVWTAVRLTCDRVASGGLLYLALYSADVQVDPPPEYWLDVKRRYVSAPWWRRRWMELAYLWRFQLHSRPWRLPALIAFSRQYKKSRGMSFMTDVRDWLGGWPMEFCRDADVVDFVTREAGLQFVKAKTGEANTEFLFRRAAA